MISGTRRHYLHIPAAVLIFAMLGGCLEAEKEPLSYTAINRTDKDIVAISVNGEGGVLHASAQNGGGATICCVLLPKKWQPGLTAKIAWQEGGVFKRDERGNVVKERGVPIVIESPWKEKIVEIPRYSESMGTF